MLFDRNKDSSVLVTGPNGLLGATIIADWKGRGMSVKGIDVDIRDREKLFEIGRECSEVSWIVHTAAKTSAAFCEKNRELAYETNVEGARNVRDLAREIGARLLYISTTSVFPCDVGGYVETDLPYPKNYYSLTKYLGEVLMKEYSGAQIVRFTLLGIHPDGSRGSNFLEWLVDSYRKNDDVKLFSDVLINPISSLTAADFIHEIIERDIKEPILHLGSRQAMSKSDIGRNVMEAFPGYKGKFEESKESDLSVGVYRPTQMWLDIGKFEQALGRFMPSMEDEIRRCLLQVR